MPLGADYLDLEFTLDLLDVGDQYLVDALKRLCEKAILKNITVRGFRGVSFVPRYLWWTML